MSDEKETKQLSQNELKEVAGGGEGTLQASPDCRWEAQSPCQSTFSGDK
jgi:hypothetical protein